MTFQKCPTCPKKFGYAHAALSQAFIADHLGPGWTRVAELVSAHHKAQELDYASKLVQLADRLSLKEPAEHEEGDATVKQLLSVFARVHGHNSSRYFPVRALELTRDVLFPGEPIHKPEDSYAVLWRDFVKDASDVAKLHGTSFFGSFTSLYYVLQKYTWCVPSAYDRERTDVSLFDHLRTTCAIAVSLHRSGISESDVDSLLQEDCPSVVRQRTSFSLVGGDISGVQRFLYTQTSKGVARGLRGRSFYLELLNEVAALWTLRQLDLPIANLLYAGGGHFYVLAPPVGRERLADLRRNFTRTLLAHHRGELYLALAAQDFSVAEMEPENFSDTWKSVTNKLSTAKGRRFQELEAPEIYATVFIPQGIGDPSDTCAVCRQEGAPHLLGEADKECDLCHDLKELGRDLKGAEYLLIAPTTNDSEPSPGTAWQRSFLDLGFHVKLLTALQTSDIGNMKEGALLLRLNSTVLPLTESAEVFRALARPPAFGFRFVARATPVHRRGDQSEEIADFETLAGAAEGVSRIGILRMDVDDLGRLFSEGLKDNASISRVVSLSFLLRLFFEGWLNQLLAEFNPYSNGRKDADKAYAIYAGGDDLFVAGAWSAIPDIACRVHCHFSDFTCRNPKVHISAGTAIDDPHAPLYQLAEAARESLDGRAKRFGVDGGEKNAIDFLGHTMSWEEFGAVQEQCDRLRNLLNGGEAATKETAPRSLLQLVMALHRQYQEAQKAVRGNGASGGPRVHYGPWMWQAAYFLTRMIDRLGAPAAAELKELRDSLTDAQGLATALPRTALAARWAELLTRKEEERKP